MDIKVLNYLRGDSEVGLEPVVFADFYDRCWYAGERAWRIRVE